MDIVFARQPDLMLESICLQREDWVSHAGFCLARPAWQDLREARARYLHQEELAYFATLKFERRQISYLTGRYCAKQAILQICPGVSPSSIAIRPGVFQYPVVCGEGRMPQVSISHAANWGAAVAFPEEHPMAVDIEEVDGCKASVIRSVVTAAEYDRVASLAGSESRALTLLWTAKEAMSKVIRCGMMTPFTVFEIGTAQRAGPAIVCTFPNFGQYKSITYWSSGVAISLVSPKNTSFGHLSLGIAHG